MRPISEQSGAAFGPAGDVQAPPAAGGSASAFRTARFWRPAAASATNALTCDVEDYFQVSAFENLIPRSRWNEMECRLPRNVDRVLEVFDDAGVNGTFFTLGWAAERFPEVIRRITDAGHEIASHGMRHARVWSQSPAEFREDVVRAKHLLEDATGQPVRGYRAASWSLDERTPWAYSILRESGYEYSSSLYPIAHDHYGVPAAPARPFYAASADLLEIPATTARFAGRNWPASGGGYFRLLPFAVSKWLLDRAIHGRGVPGVFYFHPWELDPEQPRVAGADARTRFRHYVNLRRFEPRLRALLRSLKWGRMDRVFLDGEAAADAST